MCAQAALPFPRAVQQPVELSPVTAGPQFQRLRESLAAPIAARLSTGSELIHSLEKKRRPLQPTMLGPFDRVLAGGLQRGKLTELAGRRSSGRFGICLAALAAVTSSGEAAALVDLGDHLDPQIAHAAGVDLPRLLWVRPAAARDAVAAAEMLIATGFPLVIIDLGVRLNGKRVADATWVRLARSAEAYGAAVMVSTPLHVAGAGAAAVVNAWGGKVIWKGRGKSPRLLTRIESSLTLEKHRRLITGRTETLKLRYDESIVTAETTSEAFEQIEITAATA